MRPGPRNLITDVPGLSVGNASDPALKSGVTVLLPDAPLAAGVHVMGGAPGTRETDLLAPDKLVEHVHALVLSGGSAFGLDAASGVMDALAARRIGFPVRDAVVPIVPAAIIMDLLNGGDKDWEVNPYRALGLAALQNAARSFEIGSHGAGTGATTCDLKGGLGSASLVLPDGATVGAIVACNPLGTLVGPDGHFWAAHHEIDAEFGGLGPIPHALPPAATFATKIDAEKSGHNTTIAIVATDAALTPGQLHRLATAAHDGMARAIMPSHTPFDGDLVFSASTGQRPLTDPVSDMLQIGHAAALCLSRAIARAIFAASPAPGDTLPTWQMRFARP